MKLKAYLLVGSVLFFGIAADTKDAKPTEGANPGDLAPRIVLNENETEIHFQDQAGHYTLINFWAAYDAESRARNIRLWNEVNKWNATSGNLKTSVFEATVATDKLEGTNQLHEKEGRQSDVFRKYKLEKGLRNFLIDENGVIIAANVTPEKLTEYCKQI